MNNQRTVTDEELDVLAEGELSLDQRTDLFRRLDKEPWQWKNCALAILETQAVRESLRGCLAENRTAVDRIPQPVALASQPSHRSRLTGGWMLVASVLLALAAGSLAGYQWADSRQSPHSLTTPDLAVDREPEDIREPEYNPMQAVAQSTLSWLNVRDEKLLALVRLDDGGKSRFVPIVSSETLADRLQETPTQ
jgi:hypothetical protein